jgi:arylsulfatase A-like enzyme
MPHPTLFYNELARAPLLVRHPGKLGSGQQISGLCQPADIFATVLDLAGIPRVPWAQGNSLVPRLAGQPPMQQLAIGGSYPIKKDLVGCLAVWTDEWCLMYNPLRGLDNSELYHRPTDPAELKNVIVTHRDVARKLYDQLVKWLDNLGVSSRRKMQLLSNEGFPRFHKAQYNLMLWRKRCSYWRKYRDYAHSA